MGICMSVMHILQMNVLREVPRFIIMIPITVLCIDRRRTLIFISIIGESTAVYA